MTVIEYLDESMVRRVMTDFFPEDLPLWEADPEGFYIARGLNGPGYHVRANLYGDIIGIYQTLDEAIAVGKAHANDRRVFVNIPGQERHIP